MAALPITDPAQALWDRIEVALFEKISPFATEIPVHIGNLSRELGLRVKSQTLSADVSGLIKLCDDGAYEIQVNNTDAPVRQRFTVAHEVAHFLLHRPLIGKEGIEDNILYRSRLSNRQEAEANKLAAALLLPWKEVKKWHDKEFGVEPTRENIDQIAKAFRTSSLAVGYRFSI